MVDNIHFENDVVLPSYICPAYKGNSLCLLVCMICHFSTDIDAYTY